ncbi:MAG: V-type ATP synthase subunit D, partial [Elusimicrobia bacterium]|nr:V-type ATP synthase subunit D [Elusimicrobiota bacterium]
ECQENIRIIRIYLGDQMANAVGIGKVAKKKLELAEV